MLANRKLRGRGVLHQHRWFLDVVRKVLRCFESDPGALGSPIWCCPAGQSPFGWMMRCHGKVRGENFRWSKWRTALPCAGSLFTLILQQWSIWADQFICLWMQILSSEVKNNGWGGLDPLSYNRASPTINSISTIPVWESLLPTTLWEV